MMAALGVANCNFETMKSLWQIALKSIFIFILLFYPYFLHVSAEDGAIRGGFK
jgi:hypothetical protein